MDEVTELRTIIAKANARLDSLKTVDRRRESMLLVGKCFRYRNSYSLPQKPSDYWYLYTRVYGVDSDGYPLTFGFQIDKEGKVFFEQERTRATYLLGDECPLKEYRAAYRKAIRLVHKMAENVSFPPNGSAKP